MRAPLITAVCCHPACSWACHIPADADTRARDHADASGHRVRVVETQVREYEPQRLEAAR